MQRYLLICRHAETEDPYPLQSDFERELTHNGAQQAKDTGVWLRENFGKVERMLVSPAKRASHTARIIAGKLYFDEEKIDYLPDLYNAKEHQLLQCISELPGNVSTVLLIAHNPGITRLVREITDKMIGYLETGQVVAVKIKLDAWEQIHYTSGSISGSSLVNV